MAIYEITYSHGCKIGCSIVGRAIFVHPEVSMRGRCGVYIRDHQDAVSAQALPVDIVTMAMSG